MGQGLLGKLGKLLQFPEFQKFQNFRISNPEGFGILPLRFSVKITPFMKVGQSCQIRLKQLDWSFLT